MTASQLSIYNGALRLLGEEKLASITEAHERRYILDDIWNDGFTNYVLEQGQWNFAIRTSLLTYDSGIEPSFGPEKVHPIPSDLVRLVGISADDRFSIPLENYRVEGGYWYTDHEEIYVRYVSNDASYGLSYGNWPETFNKYAVAEMAFQSCERMVQNRSKLGDMDAIRKKRLIDARSKDAMSEASKKAPVGSWSRSRIQGGFHRGRGYQRA